MLSYKCKREHSRGRCISLCFCFLWSSGSEFKFTMLLEIRARRRMQFWGDILHEVVSPLQGVGQFVNVFSTESRNQSYMYIFILIKVLNIWHLLFNVDMMSSPLYRLCPPPPQISLRQVLWAVWTPSLQPSQELCLHNNLLAILHMFHRNAGLRPDSFWYCQSPRPVNWLIGLVFWFFRSKGSIIWQADVTRGSRDFSVISQIANNREYQWWRFWFLEGWVTLSRVRPVHLLKQTVIGILAIPIGCSFSIRLVFCDLMISSIWYCGGI